MSAKKQTVKYIIYCLIILGCDLLQNVQGLFPEVWGARCFLLLPVTIILAMGEDEKNGALLGLFAGLLWDLTSGVHMGFNCIFIMIMCFFSCALVTYIARDIFITNFVSITVATVLYGFIYWLFRAKILMFNTSNHTGKYSHFLLSCLKNVEKSTYPENVSKKTQLLNMSLIVILL